MSNNRKPPRGVPIPIRADVKVPPFDVKSLPDIKCVNPDCDGTFFIQGSMVKKIPSLVDVPGSPIGHEGYVSRPATMCPKCWTQMPEKP